MSALFLIVLVDLIGFGIIIPLLPFFAEHFDASPFEVGLVMASYSAAQLVAAPAWGRISDRIGRRPVLLATLFGMVAGYVALAAIETLAGLFAVRILTGFMAGNISTAFAYVADVTAPEARARGMGIIGAAFGLGFIAGPAIGGLLAGPDPAAADFRTPALAAALLSALAFALVWFRLPESLSPEARARPPGARASGTWLEMLRRPRLNGMVGLMFLATFVFAGMEATFAIWSERRFGWGPEQNGYLFAFIGILSAAIQGGAIGRLAARFGERRLVSMGAILLALGLGAIPFAANVYALVPAIALAGAGFSLVSPALNSLISLEAGERERGGIMGFARSSATLGRVLGPAWAGAIFDLIGKDAPYFGGALLMVLLAVLAPRVLKDRVTRR